MDAIKAFSEIEVDLKKMLQHLRHETNKHEPAYFAAVHNLSDKQLTNFSGMYPFLLFSWNLLGLAKTFASPSISQAAICVAPTLRLKRYAYSTQAIREVRIVFENSLLRCFVNAVRSWLIQVRR